MVSLQDQVRIFQMNTDPRTGEPTQMLHRPEFFVGGLAGGRRSCPAAPLEPATPTAVMSDRGLGCRTRSGVPANPRMTESEGRMADDKSKIKQDRKLVSSEDTYEVAAFARKYGIPQS